MTVSNADVAEAYAAPEDPQQTLVEITKVLSQFSAELQALSEGQRLLVEALRALVAEPEALGRGTVDELLDADAVRGLRAQAEQSRRQARSLMDRASELAERAMTLQSSSSTLLAPYFDGTSGRADGDG